MSASVTATSEAAGGSPEFLVEARGIVKKFGAFTANDHVDLAIRPGEIHALLGENGAGKSTLVKMLYGSLQPTAGRIFWKGEPVVVTDPARARDLGIGMVFQHFSLFEALTVTENIALALANVTDMNALADRISTVSRDYGLPLEPRATVADLSVGERQRIEIVRCLLQEPKLLIMDEPTAVLTPQEADQLFLTLERLASEGCAVLYISHRLEEVKRLCHASTILRHGKVVARVDPSKETAASLARLMVGADVHAIRPKHARVAGPTRLYVDVLDLPANGPFAVALQRVSLELRAGEILAIAGVAGNGQSELMEVIAGIRHATSGRIRLGATDITALDPSAIRDLGLAHIPEDRHRMGLVLAFTAEENLMLGHQDDPRWASGLLLDTGALRHTAETEFAEFDVRPPDPALRTALFSGGNQQKIILAREIGEAPKALIVGQPTRGVDIGAIEAIHRRLIALRDAGRAILLVSAELDEIRSLADRILCMCQGRITGECRPDASEAEIGLMMAGIAGGTAKEARS